MAIVLLGGPWTLAASEICADALEHLGVIADGETASSGDMQTALRALNGVLKELPLFGYHWPALSGENALAWGNSQAVVLPADYYGSPVVWSAASGARVRLTQLTHAEWIAQPIRTQSGTATHFCINPLGDLLVWPVPSVNPVLTLQYQRVVGDAEIIAAPMLPLFWLNPLGYGVANELALKFGVPQDKRAEIAQRWDAKKSRALEGSIASEVISFSVAD